MPGWLILFIEPSKKATFRSAVMARECCSVLLAMGHKWLVIAVDLWRKVRDSNPRYPKRVYRISSPARSFTLPTFLKCVCKSNEFCWIRQTFVQKIRWSFPKISPWMLLPQLDVRAFCITFHTVTTFSAWYFHFPTYEHRITSLCLWWQHLFAMTPCRHFLAGWYGWSSHRSYENGSHITRKIQ